MVAALLIGATILLAGRASAHELDAELRVAAEQRVADAGRGTRTAGAEGGNREKTGFVLRGSDSVQSKQGAVYAPGVSAETVGSKALFLGTVTLPPGGRTKAHVHEHHESAFYMLSGEEVELWTGDELQHRGTARPGDYLFIPANVPHVAVNRSKTTPAVFVGARNEPTAQESVVMHPELDAKIP